MKTETHKNPLSTTHRVKHYKRLYNENHRVFCKRFIETYRYFYMDEIMEFSMENGLTVEMLYWGFYETDIFLCLVRHFLDQLMDVYGDKTVEYVMKQVGFRNIFTQFSREIQNDFYLI